MSATDRSLPPGASLEQQKKLAKELLRGWRGGDEAARARVRRQLPDKQRISLADAQFVLAREYGFASWTALRTHVETTSAAGGRATADADGDTDASAENPTNSPADDASDASDESDASDASDAARAATAEQFRRLVERGDAPALRALLARSAAARALVDAPIFSFGGTAIGQARDVTMVDALLAYGADPNRKSDWWAGGFHPLHMATGAVAERLIRGGAVPDACAAAHLDRVDLLRRILDDEPERVHERGGDGQTPLHFARSRAVVDLLLERGADIDARDVDHRSTPAEWMLDRTRGAGRYAIAEYLVARGASCDIFLAAALGLADRIRALLDEDPARIDLRTGQGEYGEQPPSSYHIYMWTIGPNLYPIQVAEQFEQHTAVESLRAGATPKQRFLAACVAPRPAEAKQLLHDLPHLIDELGADDHRALADAAWAPDPTAVALMMELDFDPAVTGPSGGTALHCAAWQGSVGCVRAILAHPRGRALANVRDATWHGSPLGWCWHGAEHCGNPIADHATVARLLVEAGSVPDPEWQELPAWLAAALRGAARD